MCSSDSESDFESETESADKIELTPSLTLHQKQDIKLTFTSTLSEWLPRAEINKNFPNANIGRKMYEHSKNIDASESGIHRSDGVTFSDEIQALKNLSIFVFNIKNNFKRFLCDLKKLRARILVS